MAVIKELLRVEDNGGLSFGDYSLPEKTKREGFEYQGDLYKVKTFSEITKLEKNGMFVYESVPGTAVQGLTISEEIVAFTVYGNKDSQFTMELEPDCEYTVYLDGVHVGRMKTNMSGKISVSAPLTEGVPVEVKIVRE